MIHLCTDDQARPEAVGATHASPLRAQRDVCGRNETLRFHDPVPDHEELEAFVRHMRARNAELEGRAPTNVRGAGLGCDMP